MVNQYSDLARHYRWWADYQCAAYKITDPLASKIYNRGSLTQALIDLSGGEFSVNVLRQSVAVPYAHEQRKLGRPLSRAAIVREVELMIHQQAVVFARSVIPLSLLSNAVAPVRNLGAKPLGQLLFSNGKIRVSKREFAQINYQDETIFARRTPYDYEGSRVLVAEYFLPALNNYI